MFFEVPKEFPDTPLKNFSYCEITSFKAQVGLKGRVLLVNSPGEGFALQKVSAYCMEMTYELFPAIFS